MIKHLFTLIWNRRRKNIMLTLEIFLSFMIIFAVLSAVIFFMDRYQEPVGYISDQVWLINGNIQDPKDSALVVDTKARLVRELENMPEIEYAAYMSSNHPLSGNNHTVHNTSDRFEIRSEFAQADPNLQSALGLEMTSGRWFHEEDYNAAISPIIISNQLKEDILPDTMAEGVIIPLFGDHKVIGVFDHLKLEGRFSEEKNVFFTLIDKYDPDRRNFNLILRMAPSTTLEFEEKLSETIQSIVKDWPFLITNLKSRETIENKKVWIPMIILLVICGFLVFNVALGLFGVVWYNISKRKSEIGLRMAIGASSDKISWQFVMEIMILATIGILLGIFFSIQVPLLELFDSPLSVYLRAIVFSATVIYILVLICTFLPSRQAGLIQPATALHEE